MHPITACEQTLTSIPRILDAEIKRLQTELMPLEAHISHAIPSFAKEWYLDSLENFARDYSLVKRLDIPEEDRPTTDRSFHCFSKLPTELRLKIWEYSFTEHLLPPVHCIKELRYVLSGHTVGVGSQVIIVSGFMRHEKNKKKPGLTANTRSMSAIPSSTL